MKGITTVTAAAIALVLFLIVGFIFFSPFFGFDWPSYFQLGEDFFESSESSYVATERAPEEDSSLDYSSFTLDPDAGLTVDEMTELIDNSDICKKIEGCIELYDSLHGDELGCELLTLTRAEGHAFPINELQSAIRSCSIKPLTSFIGGTEKEVCSLNTGSFSSLELDSPNDFYYNTKKCKVEDKSSTQATYVENNIVDSNGDVKCTDCSKTAGDNCKLIQKIDLGEDYDTSNSLIYVALGTSNDANAYVFGEGATSNKDEAIVYEEDTGGYALKFMSDYDWPKGGDDEYKYRSIRKIYGVATTDFWGTVIAAAGGVIGLISLTEDINVDQFYVEVYDQDRIEENLGSMSYSKCNPPPDDVTSTHKILYDDYSPAAKATSTKRGNIKISLGSLDTTARETCDFNIHICSQDAFIKEEVNYDDETSKIIYDFFKEFNPHNNLYSVESFQDSFTVRYNYIEFDLDRDYSVSEITTAIESGFRDWSRDLFPFYSQNTYIKWLSSDMIDGIGVGEFARRYNSDLLFDKGCSVDSEEDITGEMATKQRTLMHNCHSGICKRGKLRVSLGFRGVYLDNTIPFKNPIWPTITFCDET